MKEFPFYTQLDSMVCGPTCLRMVAKYYEVRMAGGHSDRREESYHVLNSGRAIISHFKM